MHDMKSSSACSCLTIVLPNLLLHPLSIPREIIFFLIFRMLLSISRQDFASDLRAHVLTGGTFQTSHTSAANIRTGEYGSTENRGTETCCARTSVHQMSSNVYIGEEKAFLSSQDRGVDDTGGYRTCVPRWRGRRMVKWLTAVRFRTSCFFFTRNLIANPLPLHAPA